MPRIEKSLPISKPLPKKYSYKELQDFHIELEANYRKQYKTRSGDYKSCIDFIQYHINQKSMKDDRTIIVRYDVFGEMILPPLYEEIEEKIRQYKTLIFNKEYAKRKEVEHLEELAKQIGA